MTALSIDSIFNTTFFGEIVRHITECSSLVSELISSAVSLVTAEDTTKIIVPAAATLYDQLSQLFSFDEFQIILLKSFLFMQFSTLLLIILSWKVYGKRISERFMKPATSKAIQELKDSVSKLKLPKEHTPRI